MKKIEILVVGIMLFAIPITVMGIPDNPENIARQEGGDNDEQTHP